jgi:hypothetical protein
VIQLNDGQTQNVEIDGSYSLDIPVGGEALNAFVSFFGVAADKIEQLSSVRQRTSWTSEAAGHPGRC